jgi:hypothetical protein
MIPPRWRALAWLAAATFGATGVSGAVLAQQYSPAPPPFSSSAILPYLLPPPIGGYLLNPRADPEPFRCSYAPDANCPGRVPTSGWMGDPRQDPEPFRCLYAADITCPPRRAD